MTIPLKILAKFHRRLNLEISKKTEALNLMFIMKNHAKGNFTDEDLIELRGYYKGLKVAREILERAISEEKEKNEEQEDKSGDSE